MLISSGRIVVSIVQHYEDSCFSLISSQKWKSFFPFRMGPRSNLLSNKKWSKILWQCPFNHTTFDKYMLVYLEVILLITKTDCFLIVMKRYCNNQRYSIQYRVGNSIIILCSSSTKSFFVIKRSIWSWKKLNHSQQYFVKIKRIDLLTGSIFFKYGWDWFDHGQSFSKIQP